MRILDALAAVRVILVFPVVAISSGVLISFVVILSIVPFIFGTGPGGDKSLPSVVGKRKQQFQTGTQPFEILAGLPEFSRNRVPGKM